MSGFTERLYFTPGKQTSPRRHPGKTRSVNYSESSVGQVHENLSEEHINGGNKRLGDDHGEAPPESNITDI
jgi:hypothetical protein